MTIKDFLRPMVQKAIEGFNSGEGQAIIENLRAEYLASTTAKHTKEEWESIKQKIIENCVLQHITQNKNLLDTLSRLVYNEINNKE